MRFLNRVTAWLVPVYFLVGAVLVGVTFRYPLVTDDPYITYRYAANLANGTGFVFNAGERVLSTTTPLYAILLGTLGLVGLPIPTMGYWISVIALGVSAFFVFRIAQFFGFAVGGVIAGAALLVAPALLLTFGLETNFYLAMGTAVVYFYLTGRVIGAFALCALLTLTRNDGVILMGVLGGHYLFEKRREIRDWRLEIGEWRLFAPIGGYVLILVPWLVFAWVYFGSPFPFTLAAKVAQAQSGLWDAFGAGFVKWVQDNVVWLFPLMVFAVAGVVWAIRERSLALLMAVWAVGHVLAYTILRVAFYPWYVAAVFPALCLFAGMGVELAARWVDTRIGYRKLAFGAVLLACGVYLLVVEVRAAAAAGMLEPSPKVEAYERAAAWLAENAAGGAKVDALEVGVIGYGDKHPTYDFVGLVDPMRVNYLRERRFADGVRRRAAEYVVMIPPDTWLPNDVWFKDAYRAVQEIKVKGFYSGRPLVIYERADAGKMPIETIELKAAFEKWIELESVELFMREVARGETLPVRLNLRALKLDMVPEDWKFTVQLVGEGNRVAAQTDNFYPARLPEDGKLFADYQGIPIPKDAPPGEYDLILAMYDVKNNERLSFYDGDGNEAGDFIELGKVRVQ